MWNKRGYTEGVLRQALNLISVGEYGDIKDFDMIRFCGDLRRDLMSYRDKEITIVVHDFGDPSVGIPHVVFEVKPSIFIEENERESIRKAFEDAFSLVTDCPNVEFSDEAQKRVEEENKMLAE